MALDMEQSQRRDIDTSLNNRLSLDIDEENVTLSPYVLNITKYGKGNNWINGEGLVMKNNVSEEDSIKFTIPKIPSFSQKDITGINVEFDYEINNQFVNNPILSNVSFSRQDVTKYKLVEMELNDVGHIDITCSLFGFDNDDVYYAIVDEGFDIDFNFYGNKSNASIEISNIKVGLEFEDRLSDEIDTVVNRLNPQVDFWRDGDKLFLQIGDGSGKGRVDKTNIDTYTKEEIDNKLATKVDSEVGKMLSSNDYTLAEKVKLAGIEQGANNYSHPSNHSTGMIREESSLSNLNTEENASQHEINISIDRQMFSGDYDDLINKPDIPENVSDLTNDLDFVESGDMTTALANKQDVLISGTNIKTINNQSILGSGNLAIQGGGTGVDISTSWGDPTSDSKVPSEKLTKDSLDGKADSVHSHGGITSDGKWNGTGSRGFLLVDSTRDISSVQHISASVVSDTQTFTNITPVLPFQNAINDTIDTALGNIPSNADIVDLIYPVGSIYMSVNSTDPSTIFGGTWERLKDRFLLASGDTYNNGATGGSATVSLTQSQMPRHTHTQNGHAHTPAGDYDYFIATPTGGGAVSRNSTAGQTGTKVQNLLQSSSGVARTNTNSVTPTIKYSGGTGSSESASNGSAHENMPPYLAVYMWKRTA